MITFKPCIRKERQRQDKTWHVFIRITYNRYVRYIPTSMYVTKKDITVSFKIKNQSILDKCNELISTYRKKCASLSLELSDLPIDVVVNYLTTKSGDSSLSFTSFFDKWIKKSNLKGAANYITAVKAFETFIGRASILFTDITNASLTEFERSLDGKPRAQSMYPSAIKHVFEQARILYNDEDNGVIVIKHTLSKYTPPKQNIAKKRSLSIEQIRALFELPYNNVKTKGVSSRRDLALDCFKLSFCLLGMNSADLYNAIEYDGKNIIYNRTKTKDRRNDMAKIVVRVDERIKPVFEKYRGIDHVFCFHERFSSCADLNRAINIGLKQVGKEIGIDALQFYSARHSMATIAVNHAGISKYIVNDMLCHVDSSMRITELYIEKSFELINDANKTLLDYVFGLNPCSGA